MSEWIEYTGSDEQLKMLLTGKGRFIVDSKMSIFKNPTTFNMVSNQENLDWLRKHFADYKITRFLICKPQHPYADLIKIWADTACPVYIKIPSHLLLSYFFEYWDETKNYDFITATYPPVIVTDTPDWNIPGAEYSLTPFEEKS